MVREKSHRSWTRTPSHHHWRKMRLQRRFHLHSWADVNAFDCFIWPFMKQDCNIINKKVSEEKSVMSFLESAQVHGNFCISYPESSIYCRRDTGPPYIFCGTCIPVQWTVSMVSDMQAMTSELSCSTELSSYAIPQVPTVCFTHGSVRMLMLLSQFIQPLPPSSSSTHLFYVCLLFPCPTNVAL